MIDDLLALPPFATPEPERQRRLLGAMNEAYRFHAENSPLYRRLCESRGLDAAHEFRRLESFPYLPVHVFKEHGAALSSVPPENVRMTLHSSATSGVASTIVVDKVTARRQVKALSSVIGATLGGKRRPFLVFDAPPDGRGGALGARGAAVRGFLNLASDVRYLLRHEPDGSLSVTDEIATAIEELSEPAVVLGFTFVLYAHAIEPLHQAGVRLRLPEGSSVLHIGGWKKLVDRKVQPETFNAVVCDTLGVPPDRIFDFYGFTEQMGVTYPSGSDGDKRCPVFAEVVVRDRATLEPLPDGCEGLLEFLTPLPHAYPGIAVLTDDVGVVTGRPTAEDALGGTRFRVLGRASRSEVRGCGDIMGNKMTSAVPHPIADLPPTANGLSRPVRQAGARLLFDGETNHVAGDLFAPIDTENLGFATIDRLADRLVAARSRLDAYSTEDLATLIGAAAERWSDGDGPLAPLRSQGLLFLTQWCRADALRLLADQSLGGRRGHLDGFQALPGSRREFRCCVPRGLVCHWLAGNVPMLGMLALAQSALCRNANLVKAATSFGRVLPALLDAFRGLEVSTADGRTLRGDDILDTIAVVYFDRADEGAACAMSSVADVRVAWGGAEAVQSVTALPRKAHAQDVVFGPKMSMMAIGREALATERAARKLARGAATDASVFDQTACASPHTIFVETGGIVGPDGFAALLAEEMDKAARRIPKGPTDDATASRVEQARIAHALVGDVWRSAGGTWTVLYHTDDDRGLAAPTYSRVVTVVATDDLMRTVRFITPDIQSVGLGMVGPRRLAFAEAAARAGAARLPDIGRMTHFQSPWDGLYPMDRFVRWVSLGGPS